MRGRRTRCRPMLIVCPSCTTAYRIELSTLGAAGRTVRCARCRATWFASVSDVTPEAVALPMVPEFAEPTQAAADRGGEPDQQPAEDVNIEPSSADTPS